MELRAHLGQCPERPLRNLLSPPKGRKGRYKKNAWRLMVKNFVRVCLETEKYKQRGVPLEQVLRDVAWHYEHLVWGLQDEWKRLPDAGTKGITEPALADIYLSADEPENLYPLEP